MYPHHNHCAALGFAQIEPVATLRSVAHLFGTSKSRCGIYLLEFSKQRFYLGQAVDAVRRFGQHRKNYDEIIGFSFIPVKPLQLAEVERKLIREAERLGLILLNTVHATNVVGDTDLDMVVSPEEQVKWLAGAAQFNKEDNAPSITLPVAQQERFAEQYRKYQTVPLSKYTSQLLNSYLINCVPAPKRTEYSFWIVSCYPSTNRSTWPRLVCVSAGVMELLVMGYQKDNPKEFWGFFTVASDVLSKTFKDDNAIKAAFPEVELVRRDYRDAGQHQLSLHAHDLETMQALLKHSAVQAAAAALALRVMRKRATIYSRFHCKQLCDATLDFPSHQSQLCISEEVAVI